jgi:signal transduction histidine kinase
LGLALLRVPLFLKILLANAVIAALAGAAALLIASQLRGEGGTLVVALVLFVLATFLLGAAVNAVVIRVALTPLTHLGGTAERVRRGEMRARVPASRLADKPTERMVAVFNQMLDSVQSAHERQQELAIRVLQAEERERGRIARELYDGTAQTLAGVLIRLRLANLGNEGGPDGAAEDGREAMPIPDEIRREVALALDEVRGVARRLRPPELDELGVRPALEAHARMMTEGRELDVTIQGHIPESRLGRDAALALFRIGQEAVTNAVLHSEGLAVQVSFTSKEQGLLVEIADDGRGFDIRDLFTGTEPNLGVTGMRERAVYVGGTFSIDSAPGGGTRVRALIPWASPPERDGTPLAQAGAAARTESAEGHGPAT